MSTQGGVGQDHVCAIIADSLAMKCVVPFCTHHEALLYIRKRYPLHMRVTARLKSRTEGMRKMSPFRV